MLQRYYGIKQATGLAFTINKTAHFTADACEILVNSEQLHFEKKKLRNNKLAIIKKPRYQWGFLFILFS